MNYKSELEIHGCTIKGLRGGDNTILGAAGQSQVSIYGSTITNNT